jgi:hypothetical protein
MKGRMMRIAGYAKAPLATFVFLHPLRALKLGATYLVVKKALDMRRKAV